MSATNPTHYVDEPRFLAAQGEQAPEARDAELRRLQRELAETQARLRQVEADLAWHKRALESVTR